MRRIFPKFDDVTNAIKIVAAGMANGYTGLDPEE